MWAPRACGASMAGPALLTFTFTFHPSRCGMPLTRRAVRPGHRHARTPLPDAERRFLAILGVHLCFLPWALGTMHPWSQWTSLALAAVGFAFAIASANAAP